MEMDVIITVKITVMTIAIIIGIIAVMIFAIIVRKIAVITAVVIMSTSGDSDARGNVIIPANAECIFL